MKFPIRSSSNPSSASGRTSCLGKACLGLAFLLAAGGRPVLAMDQPPSIQETAGDRMPKAVGFASCGENQLFVLEAGTRCAACRTADEKAACTHSAKAIVAHYRMGFDGDGFIEWDTVSFYSLFPEINRMVPGPKGTLIVGSVHGSLFRITLGWGAEGWSVIRDEPYFTPDHREPLGLPSGPCQDFAVGADGSIALAYGRNVAWLPRDGGQCAKEEVKWLLPRSEENRQDGAAAKAPGILLAMDSEGGVIVVFPTAKAVFRIDPHTGDKRMIASWPKAEFNPVSVATHGRNVHIGLRLAGDAKAFAICSLIPAEEGKPYRELATKISGEIDNTLGVAHDGALLTSDPGTGEIRRFGVCHSPAGETKAERETAARQDEMAAIRATLDRLERARTAEAARKELVREEEAKEKRRRRLEERKQARGAAPAALGAGAGAADGPQQADPGLDLETAIRQHSSCFGLKPKPERVRRAVKPSRAAGRTAPAGGAAAPAAAAARPAAPAAAATARPGAPTWAQRLTRDDRSSAGAKPAPASNLNPDAKVFTPGEQWMEAGPKNR